MYVLWCTTVVFLFCFFGLYFLNFIMSSRPLEDLVPQINYAELDEKYSENTELSKLLEK